MKVLRFRDEVLPFVREWMELLEHERYDEALSALFHPEAQGITVEYLREVTENYGFPDARPDGQPCRVSSWKDAVSPPDRSVVYQDVEWFDENPRKTPEQIEKLRQRGLAGDVHFDVPLDGQWSDLTAVFFIRIVEGGFALELERIEVL